MSFLSILTSLVFVSGSCMQASKPPVAQETFIPKGTKTDTATFATGCFWCTEAVFQELKGVLKTVSGFSGGKIAHPSYEEVCTA